MGKSLVAPQLAEFIARHYGVRGRDWLKDLPGRIERYRAEWELEVEGFLPPGFASCCLRVTTVDGEAAVLKLCGPWTPARPEALALRLWDGGPAPRLLRSDESGDGALLIERIAPGEPLSTAEANLTGEVAQLIRSPNEDATSIPATFLRVTVAV